MNGNEKIFTTAKHQREFDHIEELKYQGREARKKKVNELELTRDYHLQTGDMTSYSAYTDSIRLLQVKPLVNEIVKKYMDKNPNTFASVYALSAATSLTKDLDFYNSVYERLKPEFKNHRYAKEYKERASQLQRMIKNEKFKVDIYARDKTGKLFDLDDYQAYPIIFIDVWASWCTPCIEQMPAASKMQKELVKHGVAYTYLSIDEHSTAKAWVEENSSLKLEQSYLLDSSVNKMFKNQMVIETIPRYFIINNKGELLEKEAPGPDEPEKLMEVINRLKQKIKKGISF